MANTYGVNAGEAPYGKPSSSPYGAQTDNPPTASAEPTIRISGSPVPITICGALRPQVQQWGILQDGWLSQAERRRLVGLAVKTNDGPAPNQLDPDGRELFAALTGIDPGPDGGALKRADKRMFELMKNYKNLPDYPNRVNPYREYVGPHYGVDRFRDRPALDSELLKRCQQITQEQDLADDDKQDLRGLQYLSALAEWRTPLERPTVLTIGKNTVGPLTPNDMAQYNRCNRSQQQSGYVGFLGPRDINYPDLITLARQVLNRFDVRNY